MTAKFCKDCKFCGLDSDNAEYWTCNASGYEDITDLVTGVTKRVRKGLTFCDTKRKNIVSPINPCGPEGLQWQPITPAKG